MAGQRRERDGDARGDGVRAARVLGPPGWDEFAAARRRFETTLALQGLERAYAAPGRRPPLPGGTRWRP